MLKKCIIKKTTLLKILFLAVFSNILGAQGIVNATARSTASATIVTPIKIAKNSDLNFGTFVAKGGVGNVVLDAGNTGSRKGSSNITMASESEKVAAAVFTVTGQGDAAYSITFLTNNILVYNGSGSMVVDEFTTSASKVLSDGMEIVYLGATVHVSAVQAVGAYTNLGSGIEVVVNYN
jgi:hypothetical protein